MSAPLAPSPDGTEGASRPLPAYRPLTRGRSLAEQLPRIVLNFCAMARLNRSRATTPALRRRWDAALRGRQLQLALFRGWREFRWMSQRGWFERDPDTGERGLYDRTQERLHALGYRKARAFSVVSRLGAADARARL